jgi:hypothetical protein
MKKNSDSRQLYRRIAVFAIIFAFIFFVRDAIFRELWFDEALTVTNFMMLPDPLTIYRQYVIPNNQIIYTILLKGWNGLYQPWCSIDAFWRMLSVIFGGITIGLMYAFWKKKFSLAACLPVLIFFVCSLPFEIYSTALRGYMLSTLLIVLAWHFAGKWSVRGSTKNAIWYFVICWLAVGTIPSNILALAGIVIWFFPYFGFQRIFSRRFLLLASAPLIAALLFYLPIINQVMKIMQLREGWDDKLTCTGAVYSAFALAFLPVLLLGIWGWIISLKTPVHRKFAWRIVILLIPLPIILFRTPAPFPRVFWTLWPLWMLLIIEGLRHFYAQLSRIKPVIKNRIVIIALTFSAIGFLWGVGEQSIKTNASDIIVGGKALDDYFYPYYMEPSHRPFVLLRKLHKLYDGQIPPAYLTFNSEPYVIMLYGRMLGIDARNWHFDNPRGKVERIPAGALIIMHKNEEKTGTLKNLVKRFYLRKVKKSIQEGNLAVYTVE